MPKQIHKLERFEGGINDMADPRDIADNELADCKGMVVNEVGKLRTVGALVGRVGDDANDKEASSGIQGGYGLFPFAADFNTNSAAYDSGSTSVHTQYIAVADATNEQIDIWSDDVDNITVNKITLAGSNTKAVYYYADGKLRVASASLNGGVKSFGFIEYTQFNDAGDADVDVDGWYQNAVGLTAPTDNTIETTASGSTASVTHPDGTTTTHYPNVSAEFPGAGSGLNIKKAGEYEGGNWQTGKYQLAVSFIYDYVQESLPFINATAQTFTVDSDNVGISFTLLIQGTYDERITGARIYARDTATDGSPLRLLADVGFASGSPGASASTVWSGSPYEVNVKGNKNVWTNTPSLGASYAYMIIESKELGISTYESINGFSPYLTSVSLDWTTPALVGFKTALVANRRAFIAHMRTKDETGKNVTHADRMMYSEVGKFDTFPSTNFIDIGINDGDAFTALQSFADRILAFKHNRLYVINISQGSPTLWFLESQHEGMGVFYPAATFKTDVGIIWANYSGVHFYDGARITTLTSKIESSYQSFYTTGTSVGYSPRKKQILVLKDATGGSNGDVYIYSFLTNSWIFADSLFTDSTPYTNFAIDSNQDLIVSYYSSSYYYIQKWSDTAATNTGVSIRTKDMDFGYPSQKKNVYKALVSYKGDGDSLNVKYHINGDTDTDSNFYRTNADGTSDGANDDTSPLLDSDTDDWIRAELVPVSTTQAKGIYSFGVTASGTAKPDCQINDISVLYRMIRPLD
jgi:hypothetical protein